MTALAMASERIVDRTGYTWATLAWDGDALVRLEVPPGVIVHGAIVHDPLLGDAHVIEAGALRTTMSALDWRRPTQIPALADPGRLPAGAGGAIMNVIAAFAERAGVAALRYAGPYPTPALWRTLARSFHCDATEPDFTKDLIARMATLARTEIAIDFRPAPHERVAIDRGHVELRDRLERVVLDGISYEPLGSPARLAVDRTHAEVVFGDTPYARVASFAADGTLVDGPHAIPPCTSDVIGKIFPPALALALAELVAELVPPPLEGAARRVLATHPIRWADLGAHAAGKSGDELLVHAAIWQHVGPHGLARLALAIAEALAPPVKMAALACLAQNSLEARLE